MQDNSLKDFTHDILNIREYIKYIDLANQVEIINRTSDHAAHISFRDLLHSFGTPKKLFEYKAITISLYGILEKHIGLWIKEHISQLPKTILNYNNLPEKLRNDHFTLSVKLISLISDNKSAKYEHLDRKDILSKLNSCIDNPDNYELNSEAFYLNSGNLKHSKISEAFNNIDIKLTSKLKVIGQRNEGFLKGHGTNISSRGDDLFSLIDDLVVRRNDIAHGENIDNILNPSEFSDHIEFLEGYGKAVFQALTEKDNQYQAIHLYEKIENVKGIFSHHSVLGFEFKPNKIKKGEHVIIQLQDGSFIKKEILKIERDNVEFDVLWATKNVDIAVDLGTGSGLTKNQSFYIKKNHE